MNCNLTLLIVLAFGGLLSLRASAPDEKVEIYGERDSSTIAVRIYGGGVQNAGIYNLKSPAILKDIIECALWLKSSNGTFQITRFEKGAKVTIEADMGHLDFRLFEGDVIYAKTMRVERAVTLEATPFESASLDQGQLVLKVKGAWLMDGDKAVKPGAEIRIAADGQVKLTGRHTQILVSFRPDRGALIETTFDARSFGGKLERTLEILAVK